MTRKISTSEYEAWRVQKRIRIKRAIINRKNSEIANLELDILQLQDRLKRLPNIEGLLK